MNELQNFTPAVRLRKQRINTERYERWVSFRQNLQAKAEWRHPAEILDGVEGEQLLQRFAREWLTPLFLFLAEGYRLTGKEKTGTMDKRAWAVLYAVRPDLIDGDCMSDAARRWGVKESNINYYVRQFERHVPGFRSLGGGTKKRSEADREAVGRASFARAEARRRAAQQAA